MGPMMGSIIGSTAGMASSFLSQLYNRPKNQVRRLEKAGISPNAIFGGANTGNVSALPYVNPVTEAYGAASTAASTEATNLLNQFQGLELDWLNEYAQERVLGDDGQWTWVSTDRKNYEQVQQLQQDHNLAVTDIAQFQSLWNSAKFTSPGRVNENSPQWQQAAVAELQQIVDQAGLTSINLENVTASKEAFNTMLEAIKGPDGELDWWQALIFLLGQNVTAGGGASQGPKGQSMQGQLNFR